MKKFINDLLVLIVKQAFEAYKNNVIDSLKVEAVKRILSTADNVRVKLRKIVLGLVLLFAMAVGLVLCVHGLAILGVLYVCSITLPDGFNAIPWTLVIGGGVCFGVPMYVIYGYLLSEELWMQEIKNDNLVGPLVTEVLDNARAKTNQD